MKILIVDDRPVQRSVLAMHLPGHDVLSVDGWVGVSETVNEGLWKPEAAVIGQVTGLGHTMLVRVLRRVYGPHLRAVLYLDEPGIESAKHAQAAGAEAWFTDEELPMLLDIVAPHSIE